MEQEGAGRASGKRERRRRRTSVRATLTPTAEAGRIDHELRGPQCPRDAEMPPQQRRPARPHAVSPEQPPTPERLRQLHCTHGAAWGACSQRPLPSQHQVQRQGWARPRSRGAAPHLKPSWWHSNPTGPAAPAPPAGFSTALTSRLEISFCPCTQARPTLFNQTFLHPLSSFPSQ